MRLILAALTLTFLTGCKTTNQLPDPHYTMYGYTTEDGYIYVIEPKSAKSLAIKSIHTTR